MRLLSRRRTAGRHLPINRFFASLAEDQKSAAIGVILSGTASDGTLGLQAIKSEGGVAFAQDPKSAGYPGMPESAILAGCVDFVLPPEEIARELVRLEHLPYAKRTAAVLEAEPPFAGAADLQKIIHILRTATGVDFSLYKTGTIKRRVARRMILHKIESLPTLRERILSRMPARWRRFTRTSSFTSPASSANRRRSRRCNERFSQS